MLEFVGHTVIRENHVGDSFDEQPEFVVRGRGERQQGCGAEAVQIDFAVDVREEVDGHAGANALFVAEKEHLFEFRQACRIDGEQDLVDQPVPLQVGQVFQGAHWILGAQLHCCGSRAVVGEEAAEVQAVLRLLLDHASQMQCTGSQADHHYIGGSAELAPDYTDQFAGGCSEQNQQRTVIEDKRSQKQTAEVQAQEEFKQHQRYARQRALLCGDPDRIAAATNLQAIIDLHPDAAEYPGSDREAEQ